MSASLVRAYAAGRLLFGAGLLLAPATAGRLMAGAGGAAPDAQAFLRGMGGRELGIGLGLLSAERSRGPVRPWLAAGVLADAGDVVGILGAWRAMQADRRLPGIAFAGGAALAGLVVLARQR